MQMVYSAARGAGILVIAIVLAACQTLNGTGLVASTVTTKLSSEQAGAIADDMVGHLVVQMGPGTNTIALTPDASEFGKALEGSLKATGYAVVTDQKTSTLEKIPLAYVVDDFEGSILVRLSTTHADFTRIYKLSDAGAEPFSPLSVLARGQASFDG